MKLLILNGPNLNLILERNSNYYGLKDLNEIEKEIIALFPDINVVVKTSNSENELINEIQVAAKVFDGLIINPGAFSHSSIAIRDALELCKIPKIEVHLSNLATRDEFRKVSITASQCNGSISGFKSNSYLAAIFTMNMILTQNKSDQ